MIARRRLLAAIALASLAAPALAQSSGKPVVLVVPFAPGGPTDLIARRLATALHDGLGQAVMVENRAGAGGNVGAEYVARAAADGSVILFGTSGPLAINRMLYPGQGYDPDPGQGYDPARDFAPIAPIGRIPNVLAVHASIPAHSVQELIALGRRGERFAFGSSGNGASSHLAGALFNRMAGTSFEHVPYRGTGPAMNDLIAGHIAMVFTDVLTALPHVREGRLRALGITTETRSAVLPDVPTIAEQGLPGYDASVFFGFVVPAATPPAAREALRVATENALRQTELRRWLEQQGMQIAPAFTAAALSTLMAEETARWERRRQRQLTRHPALSMRRDSC